MIVGLPGAGIGGLFYLAGALVAPACELGRAIAGDPRPRQWALVRRQFAIATSILGAMAATGWIVAVVAESLVLIGEPVVGRDYPVALARNLGTFTLSTLIAVVATVEMLRLVVVSRARTQRIAVLTIVLCGTASESSGQTAA